MEVLPDTKNRQKEGTVFSDEVGVECTKKQMEQLKAALGLLSIAAEHRTSASLNHPTRTFSAKTVIHAGNHKQTDEIGCFRGPTLIITQSRSVHFRANEFNSSLVPWQPAGIIERLFQHVRVKLQILAHRSSFSINCCRG